jgi:hypothetical protein
MNIKSFLKNNWLGLTGGLIGILGLAFSYYFFKISTSPAEPVFLLDPSRTIIVDSKRFSDTPLRVVRDDGRTIQGDVTSIRFYFWNNGRKSIRPSAILEPIVVTLEEKDGEILDHKILKVSRGVVRPLIQRDTADPKRKFNISFSVLEKNDGFTGQLIYVGNPNADLKIFGAIEGVEKILTTQQLISSQSWSEYGKKVGLMAIILVLGLFVGFILPKLQISPSKSERTVRTVKIVVLSMVAIFSLMWVYLTFIDSINIAKNIASKTYVSRIPGGIIP